MCAVCRVSCSLQSVPTCPPAHLEQGLHVKDVLGELLHVLEEHKVVSLLEDGALVEPEDGQTATEDELDPLHQEAVHDAQGGLWGEGHAQ